MKRQKTNLNNSAKLYLVGTPIGNFDDMTFRAVDTLKMVDSIYCEDTRVTALLLAHFNIKTPLKSYHVFNENELTNPLIEEIKSGKNIAVVSDAGMPLISDPGFLASRSAIENDIDVVVVPGPSASITALVGSGITTNSFFYQGFLNSRSGKRKQMLETLKYKTETLIIYESPHRIKETLEFILEVFGDRYMVLCRELTKKYEEYVRGHVSEILEVIDELKGEMVLIIEGATSSDIQEELNSKTIKEHYQFYVDQGFNSKDAMKKVALDRNIKKADVYQEIFVRK